MFPEDSEYACLSCGHREEATVQQVNADSYLSLVKGVEDTLQRCRAELKQAEATISQRRPQVKQLEAVLKLLKGAEKERRREVGGGTGHKWSDKAREAARQRMLARRSAGANGSAKAPAEALSRA